MMMKAIVKKILDVLFSIQVFQDFDVVTELLFDDSVPSSISVASKSNSELLSSSYDPSNEAFSKDSLVSDLFIVKVL